MRSRRTPGLLLASLLAAGLGQVVLIVFRGAFHLPRVLEDALSPMWPDAGAAVAAVLLFIAAAWLAAASVLRGASPGAWPEIAPAWSALRPIRARVLVPAAAGLAAYAWVLVAALTNRAGGWPGAWFAVALALFVAAVVGAEGSPFRGMRVSRGASVVGTLEVVYVVAALLAFWFLCTRDLGSWYYSSLGDEYAFHDAAVASARGEIPASLFSQEGAYGIIPVLSSFWQGQLMRLIGFDVVSWKIVTVAPLPLMLLLLYLLARTLYGRATAMLALGFLAGSHYLLAYAHTGYPNLEPLLPTVAALLLLALGLRRGSRLLLLGAGAFAGLGWYTYYTSRVAIVILVAGVVLTVRRGDRTRALWWVASGFLVLLLPMIAASGSQMVARMVEQAGNGPTGEYASNHAMLPLWNAGRSILAFNYNVHDGPYLLGSLAEPVTAALLVVGLGWLAGAWRDRRSRLLLAWYAIGLVTAGVLSKYDYVSVSRLNFLLPAVAICAAVAARQALRLVEAATGGPTAAALAGACLIAATTTLNLDRFLVEAPARLQSTRDAVALRIVVDPRCQNAARPPLVVAVGVGGALPPALRARPVGRFPEWALYDDPRNWIETADSRCVIFPVPADTAAVELRSALRRRWPSLRFVRETDLSGHVEELVAYPSRVPGGAAR